MSDIFTIGVTGSSGKTTTKEIIGAILKEEAETAVNEGNLNSEIGLPIAALQVRKNHAFAVFEMGMNRAGEMDVLVNIVRPSFAVITNIGNAHIGILGSKKAIAEEKKKIFSLFTGRETGFIPEHDDFSDFLKSDVRGKVVMFGEKTTPGYRGMTDMGVDGLLIDWEDLHIRFPLLGTHNLHNALAAITVTLELGVSKRSIRQGLEKVRPLFGRSEILKGAVTVIQDCYNANPESVRRALDFLDQVPWKGRKVIVFGSMMELGTETEQAHADVGTRLGVSRAAATFFFGREAQKAFLSFRDAQGEGYSYWTDDFDALRREVLQFVRQGDLVLLKGSRSVALERLAEPLRGVS